MGNYESSKAKFDGTGKGWNDITTCMDYAYFVTSNFFKYQPTLNKEYDAYQSLVFEKQTDASGQISYVFCADGEHVENGGRENNKLIYNPDKKTVRNGSVADAAANEIVKDEGSFFVCDDAAKDYPTLDPNMYEHNYHFTMSSQGSFVYKEGTGQYFTFSGDDDVYMYLNGKLLMDLGGAHIELTKDMYMDDLKEEFGLTDGQVCTMDFFYMERHTTQSNFYVKTNITLASDSLDQTLQESSSNTILKKNAEVTYGSDVKLNYQFAALRPGADNTNLTFTDSFGNMVGKDGFKLGEGVSLGTENKIVLTVTRKNGAVETKEFTFTNPKNPTAEEVTAVKTYFGNLKLANGDRIHVSGMVYDSGSKAYTESVASDVTLNYDSVLLGGQNTEKCTLLDCTSIKLIKDDSSANDTTDKGTSNDKQTDTSTQDNKQPDNATQPEDTTESDTESDTEDKIESDTEVETENLIKDETDSPEKDEATDDSKDTAKPSQSTNTDTPKTSSTAPKKVKTGDENNWYLPLVSCLVSAGVLVGMLWRKRKSACVKEHEIK